MNVVKLATTLCFMFMVAFILLTTYSRPVIGQEAPTEAPAGFDNLTNGLIDQATYDEALATFSERDEIADGLGPVYNAQACVECHQNPIPGGISQITELRAGHEDDDKFIPHPGGTLINSRAIDAGFQERLMNGNEVQAFRTSLNLLGDGFVEAIDSNTLLAIYNNQPSDMRAMTLQVPVMEAPGISSEGRFGWKNQHASLLSFSGDAYLNEIGVTNRLNLLENTCNGRSVAPCDPIPDPAPNGEDAENDIDIFTQFMRATKAPPRDAVLAATPEALAGSRVFDAIGCNICHVRNLTTAPAGTAINGGTFIVPPALGNKVIHPFSDFGLHNVDTGDGIVQEGLPSKTRNRMRTAPLWGVRTRERLMHDGESLTFNRAILRHGGEATRVINSYKDLSDSNKARLIAFLSSL
ncbi:MAG TPA: di-heme oxidoredictase family protein [Blastocatellia bacterium]|nr:di-heme oxidoredictase family protein [Blastocatellia bacterium]